MVHSHEHVLMYVCICINIYIYIYICIYIYVCIYIYIYVYINIHIYIYVYLYIHIYIYKYIHIYTYIYIILFLTYVYIYIYYIYIHMCLDNVYIVYFCNVLFSVLGLGVWRSGGQQRTDGGVDARAATQQDGAGGGLKTGGNWLTHPRKGSVFFFFKLRNLGCEFCKPCLFNSTDHQS